MKSFLSILIVPALVLLVSSGCSNSSNPSIETSSCTPWINSIIQTDHPRIFFNSDTLKQAHSRAEHEESSWTAKCKYHIDHLPAPSAPGDYGIDAATSAFLYFITNDSSYLTKSKQLLGFSAQYYIQRSSAGLPVSWHSTSRINALCAYDWLFNELTIQEKHTMGSQLLQHVYEVQPENSDISGENQGGVNIYELYSTPGLKWYAGLAFLNAGIDDALALEYLEEGREIYLGLLDYRQQISDDDGSPTTATCNYAINAYPWSVFNFLHSWESATGEDLSGQYPFVGLLANWMAWNWLPEDMTYGLGDAFHLTGKLPLLELYLHVKQTMHFTSQHFPEQAAVSRWILDQMPNGSNSGKWPIHPFLLSRMDHAPKALDPGSIMPPARHFEELGTVTMRSGDGSNDTYAAFIAGGPSIHPHKHFDEGHFVIHKNGRLALGSGTRPEPGIHAAYYYGRTIAHNCLTIYEPGEDLPKYWGNPAKGENPLPQTPNDGGQNKKSASQIVNFETSPQFTYIGADLTASYSSSKTNHVSRQFLYVPPNHFVIFDRVNSTLETYQKKWLIHTAQEPKSGGTATTWQADQGSGRIFCRTILPSSAELEKIGGPHQQFVVDGTNWPIPNDQMKYNGTTYPSTEELLGQWRVEVSPKSEDFDVLFLHVIEVGDQNLTSMTSTELLEDQGMVGVRFYTGSKEVNCLFSKGGQLSGHIQILDDGIDQPLSTYVQKQSGFRGD